MGRHSEDVCELCRAGLPTSTGHRAGDTRLWVLSPESWSPPVPLPAVLGPGDEIVTLSQVFSSGTLLWAQPCGGGADTLLVSSWIRKCGFRVRQGNL